LLLLPIAVSTILTCFEIRFINLTAFGMATGPSSQFIYFSCQHGAESTIKDDLCGSGGPYRLSFSQKGFVTLKSELKTPVWSKALPTHPLIRCRGHMLDRFEGEQSQDLIREILAKYGSLDWDCLHIWQRDVAQPGWHGFEPGRSQLVEMIAVEFCRALEQAADPRSSSINAIVPEGSKVLEVILIEPNRWWVAAKPVQTIEDGWPGGVYAVTPPENMISRAYLKIAEAIPWSKLPMRVDDRIVEIGSAPGGACQRLLDLGFQVTGIDPAEMDPSIANHPRFEHWRAKSLQVKRRLFRPFPYLICDANVAPNYTLDTVESIVTYPTSQFRGLILTMKMSSWEHANEIAVHVDRVKSWGFQRVVARQLAHNRREYCLVAEKVQA
jgi:23S rRNA (cytidine2498-2'-O)-methyltransferase